MADPGPTVAILALTTIAVCLATAGGEMGVPVVKTPRSWRQQSQEQQKTGHGPILRSWPFFLFTGTGSRSMTKEAMPPATAKT